MHRHGSKIKNSYELANGVRVYQAEHGGRTQGFRFPPNVRHGETAKGYLRWSASRTRRQFIPTEVAILPF